jgi:hypothetical protein
MSRRLIGGGMARMIRLAKKQSAWLLLMTVSVLVAGCSKSVEEASPEKARLTEIYELYTSYVKRNQAPPKEFADLNVRSYSEIYPGAFNSIKDGKYVVVWGVSEKDSGAVLAYPKEAPTQGGPVLMADGTVKKMTADQLQAAVKK